MAESVGMVEHDKGIFVPHVLEICARGFAGARQQMNEERGLHKALILVKGWDEVHVCAGRTLVKPGNIQGNHKVSNPGIPLAFFLPYHHPHTAA